MTTRSLTPIRCLLTAIAAIAVSAHASAQKKDLRIPYDQYYGADYTKDKTVLQKGTSTIEFNLKGEGRIYSVHAVNPAGGFLGGIGKMEGKRAVVVRGLPIVNLNCTNRGDGVPLPAVLKVLAAPGEYPNGLEITIVNDSHRVMKFTTAPLTLIPDAVTRVDAAFEPDRDILFYEGFDNFVWGGDYVGGFAKPCFATTNAFLTAEAAEKIKGNEPACVTTSYNIPGSAYFQSNDFNKALTQPICKSQGNEMSREYLISRGMWDYRAGFRCVEHPGYIGIGNTSRGMFRTPAIKAVKGIRNVTVSFDIATKAKFTNRIEFQVRFGGYIASASIDGKPLDLGKDRLFYNQATSTLILTPQDLKPAASATDTKSWHHVECAVERATDGMEFGWWTNILESESHGFYIDNIVVKNGSEMPRGDLRVLYWNIQNGMWADQQNNYDNFVEWVKRYDPDVCVWCEASTIYKDGTNEKTTDRYLPDNWGALAARYGHSYTAIGAVNDNYPQVITSKYPITTLAKIARTPVTKIEGVELVKDKYISHGAGLHRIEVAGRKINVVTMHTWPQKYTYGYSKDQKDERKASAKRLEGLWYQAWEMRYVVDATINNPEYAGCSDWLLLGDLNSRSRADQWHFAHADRAKSESEVNFILATQDAILNNTDMVDIIARKYPGDFMSSTQGNGRVDNVYASPSMYNCVKNAMIVMDGWTDDYGPRRTSFSSNNFYYQSDHRPYLVDFEFK